MARRIAALAALAACTALSGLGFSTPASADAAATACLWGRYPAESRTAFRQTLEAKGAEAAAGTMPIPVVEAAMEACGVSDASSAGKGLFGYAIRASALGFLSDHYGLTDEAILAAWQAESQADRDRFGRAIDGLGSDPSGPAFVQALGHRVADRLGVKPDDWREVGYYLVGMAMQLSGERG